MPTSPEVEGEAPRKPTFDPLAPRAPEDTREVDQWFLNQALDEQQQLRASLERADLRSPTRILGGLNHTRGNALRGEIAHLRKRLAQSEHSAPKGESVEGEVVDSEKG